MLKSAILRGESISSLTAFWLIVLLMILWSSSGSSQCMLAEATPIPDNGSELLLFHVSGLIDDDLTSPTQGICGVEIDFMHEYIGDLTITLISPVGTMVTLVGSPTTAISGTNLTRWNIRFVPCSDDAMPDAGFDDQWSNNQPWLTFAPYSGSYYPHIGCLENFNTGSANGIWQVLVQDHDEFQTGIINGLRLIFCNPDGLDCEQCIPNGGRIQDGSITICEGDRIETDDLSVVFEGEVPPTDDYTYTWLLVSGNTILQHGPQLALDLPTGNYSICGMSYANADVASVNGLLAGLDMMIIASTIEAGHVCASLSENCIDVKVNLVPDTMFVIGALCQGEEFSFREVTYTTPGIYYQTFDGPGSCDTVVEVLVRPRDLSVTIAGAAALDCGDTLSLSAMATGAAGPFTWQWSTPAGNIVSPTDLQLIEVNQPGQYTAMATDGICSGEVSATVEPGEDAPHALINSGIISCANPTVDIHPVYVPVMSAVEWTGPGGFVSTTPDITVSLPGEYFLALTAPSGCKAVIPITIGVDTATLPITVLLQEKDCQSMVQRIGHAVIHPYTATQWEGPNGYSSTELRPLVTDPGTYVFTGTFSNGCTRSAEIYFNGDFSIPDLTLPDTDTINCGEVITLTASSAVPGVTYYWLGPQQVTSSDPLIVATQDGAYFITVTSPNSCRNLGQVDIALGDDVFDYEIFADTLTCSIDSVEIGVFAPDADLFHWIGHPGPDSTSNSIRVGLPGVYKVMVMDTHSGCEMLLNVYAPGDLTGPPIQYTAETITCLDTISTLMFHPVPGVAYTNVYWELPDMTIVPGSTVESNQRGEHRLYAVGENGCTAVRSVFMIFDTQPPLVLTESGVLNCKDTIQLGYQSLQTIVSAQWEGPSIIDTSLFSITVNEPGMYSVTVTGENGCSASYALEVDSNFVVPEYNLTADSLRCDGPTELMVSSHEPGVTYSWIDPAGIPFSADPVASISDPGTYVLIVTGTNRCETRDTIDILPHVYPKIHLTSDTLTCAVREVEITATTLSESDHVYWLSFQLDTISHSGDAIVMDVGPFEVVALGSNQCETRDTLTVPVDTVPPIAVIRQLGELRCQEREVMFDGGDSSPSELLWFWSTIGGHIESDPLLPLIMARDTGVYSLLVTRIDNGCTDSVIWILSEHPDAIQSVTLDLSDPGCYGESDGSIEISGVIGGISPFLYSIDGGVPRLNGYFPGLNPDSYVLTIQDSEGCAYDTLVMLHPADFYGADAGADQEIALGESAQIFGTTEVADSAIVLQSWSTLLGPVCSGCNGVEVNPLETTIYIYTVQSATGCTISDTMTVFVLQRPRFYIPNVFTPNGDGINDVVQFHGGPGISRVVRWIIFDRWGNAVYGKTDFAPDDPTASWDGLTSTGEPANPAVFPYMIDMELISGKRVIFHGDITLLR